MTINIRQRSGAGLLVVLVASACAGGPPVVEPPGVSPVELPRVSAVEPLGVSEVSPTSTAAVGVGSSPGIVSSSTVVSPPVSSPSELEGGLGGVFVDVSAGFGYSCGLRMGGWGGMLGMG